MAFSLCAPSSFTSLSLFGGEVVAVAANIVSLNQSVPTRLLSTPVTQIDISFCNVTVSYTHPGYNDFINVETWLPGPEAWNERIWATGGGGFSAGRQRSSGYGMDMPLAVNDGYVATATDAGIVDRPGINNLSDGGWGLLTPGNLDLVRFNSFAARSLEEQGLLGRQVVQAFYGRAHAFSYFGGCSQGGRQALTIARMYPDLYDGILANAPAADINVIAPQIYWPHQFMTQTGQVSRNCEVDAITAAAVEACDGFDGIEDGIVAEFERCAAEFDPYSVVGKTVDCQGVERTVTLATANVVNATWDGLRSAEGKRLWSGVTPGSDLTGSGFNPLVPGFDIVTTTCEGDNCVGIPFPLGPPFIKYFLALDNDLDLTTLDKATFDGLVKKGRKQLGLWLTTDPDLTDFQRAGGKLITMHGTADTLIPIGGMLELYEQISAVSPDVHDFYRLFKVPGLAHCYGGKAGTPDQLHDQLRAWVEEGTIPENSTYEALHSKDGIQNRVLCPFPQKATFDAACGDAGREECWTCVGHLS